MKAAFSSITLASAILLLSNCNEVPPRERELPKPVVTDTRPVGDGLKVVGYAILGGAVVVTLGRLLR
ncbi:MAG: hypothetical protein JWO82_2587 [Akkermansiaceae bacterium]|nr:hypothetical protein [Akkermansiaceae bacterium]